MNEKPFFCPNRLTSLQGRTFRYDFDFDNWKDGKCSYCDSIHPDTFMELIKQKVLPESMKSMWCLIGDQPFNLWHLSLEQQLEYVEFRFGKTLPTG